MKSPILNICDVNRGFGLCSLRKLEGTPRPSVRSSDCDLKYMRFPMLCEGNSMGRVSLRLLDYGSDNLRSHEFDRQSFTSLLWGSHMACDVRNGKIGIDTSTSLLDLLKQGRFEAYAFQIAWWKEEFEVCGRWFGSIGICQIFIPSAREMCLKACFWDFLDSGSPNAGTGRRQSRLPWLSGEAWAGGAVEGDTGLHPPFSSTTFAAVSIRIRRGHPFLSFVSARSLSCWRYVNPLPQFQVLQTLYKWNLLLAYSRQRSSTLKFQKTLSVTK